MNALRSLLAALLLLVLGCDPIESASSLASAGANVGSICHWTREDSIFTPDDLATLADGECIVVKASTDATLFVYEGATCEDVEAAGESCAVLTNRSAIDIWSDDLAPAGHIDQWVGFGAEVCTCD